MKNLGELKTAIADYLDRTDLTAVMPTFIRLAETKIYRNLRTRENEFTLQITEATLPEPISPIVLPQNFREFKQINLNDRPIENVSTQRFSAIEGNRERTDLQYGNFNAPQTYFATVERKLQLTPWATESPDTWSPFTLDIIYYGTESITDMATWPTPTNPHSVPESDGTPSNTTLRGDAATTRLFLVAPDLYLYGALAEAYTYLLVPEKATMWGGAFGAVLADLKKEGRMSEFSGSTVNVSGVGL